MSDIPKGWVQAEGLSAEEIYDMFLPKPVCKCDIQQLWRGSGHQPNCPETNPQ